MNKNLCADRLWKKGIGGLTRRGWLKSTSLIVAAGALSRLTVRASTEISPVMDKLSSYMTEARHRELPVKVLQETERHILDTMAAMVSGSVLVPGREAIKFARNYGGEKIATVVASKVLCGPIEACLLRDPNAPRLALRWCTTAPSTMIPTRRTEVESIL